MERAPIEVRVNQAAALLKESQALVDDVAEELRIRGEELERLAKETARQQQLAEISKEGAEAIEALVSNRIREENSRMEKRTTRQQWIFLIVGTVCLGGLVSLIIELATS